MVIFVGVFREVLGKALMISLGLVGVGRFGSVFPAWFVFFGSSSLRSVAAYRFWLWIGSIPVISAPSGRPVVAGVGVSGADCHPFLPRSRCDGQVRRGCPVGLVSDSLTFQYV
jgi:hypothetical protein